MCELQDSSLTSLEHKSNWAVIQEGWCLLWVIFHKIEVMRNRFSFFFPFFLKVGRNQSRNFLNLSEMKEASCIHTVDSCCE